MTFENNFTSLSLCCPARTATLCGQYAHNSGVFTNSAKNSDGTPGGYVAFMANDNDKKTVAVTLQEGGYRTALMGKYLNGYSASAGVPYTIPFGWTEWASPLEGNTYNQYNYTLNANGKEEEHYLSNCKVSSKGKNCEVDTQTTTKEERVDNYMLNVLKKKATEFITKSSKDGAPFYLHMATFNPHYPATPAPKYENLLTDQSWLDAHKFPKTASFNELDVSDKPSWLKDNAALLKPGYINQLEQIYRKRLISMYAVEDMVSDLINTLDKNGQLDNTYIIFTSDNGYHLGQHRLTGGKLTEFDTDLKVPLMIRGPRVVPGTKVTELTANVDLNPTFTELAGLKIPSTVDGRSFKDLLLGKTTITRNAILLEHADPSRDSDIKKLVNNNDEPRDMVEQTSPITGGEFVGKYVGVRTKQYTYIHYEKNNEEELYDNINDPEQLENVASVAGSGLMKILRKWSADLSTCAGETCRSIEAEDRLNGVTGALDGKACFFGGKQINNGTSRVFYSNTSSTNSCDLIKQVRTCKDGVLSGDSIYNQISCTVKPK